MGFGAKLSGLLAMGTALMSSFSAFQIAPATAASVERPNILLIMTDDQRAGSEKWMAATMRLFRDEGTRFTNAFATTPLCCPARASFFTGRYAHNHGLLSQPFRLSYGLDQESTIQSYLQSAGSFTALIGKYFVGWPLKDNPPHFDRWSMFTVSRRAYEGGSWNVDGVVTEVDQYSTTYMADRARDLLQGQEVADDDPWFLVLAPPAPHPRFAAEVKYAAVEGGQWTGNAATREEDLSDKPPWVQAAAGTGPSGSELRVAQLRTLMSVDDMVEDVFSTLVDLDENRNTFAIFTSDNGFMWGEHGLNQKRAPYTKSVKIPFYVRWPGHLEENGVDRRLIANIDVAPTILDVYGVVPPVEMDGRSLFDVDARETLLLEYWSDGVNGIPDWLSLRSANEQYVEYFDPDESTIFTEFYSLDEDPQQLSNLSVVAPDQVGTRAAEMHELLTTYRYCQGRGCP